MKKVFNIALSSIFALLLMTSCDKEEAKIIPEQEKEISNKEMAYEKNPYDKGGAIHNDFLNYFIKNIKSSEELNADELFNHVKTYLEKNKMEFGEKEQANFSEAMKGYSDLQIGTAPIYINLCKYFPFICDILNPSPFNPQMISVNNSNGGTSTSQTLNFIASIKKEEDKVIADRKMSDEDKRILLSYYSVARHSAGYWHNVNSIKKESSLWSKHVNTPRPAALKDVVAADAAGTAIGTFIGGPGLGNVLGGIASALAYLERDIIYY